MIRQHGSSGGEHGGVDLDAVFRDAELLDLLAVRADAPDDDLVAGLLAALAAEVDEGLDLLLQELDGVAGSGRRAWGAPRTVGPPAAPAARSRQRGHGFRASTVAVVLGATLSVSGVAAAVTGDPFAAYHGLVSAVTGHEDLPPSAARVAVLNRQLAGTRARIAHGDLTGARAEIDALQARLDGISDLTKGERTALAARIAALEAALTRATATADAREAQQKGRDRHTGRSRTPEAPAGKTAVPQHTRSPSPHHTKSSGPKHTTAPQPGGTKVPAPEQTQAADQQPIAEPTVVVSEPVPTSTTPGSDGPGRGGGPGGAATTPAGAQHSAPTTPTPTTPPTKPSKTPGAGRAAGR